MANTSHPDSLSKLGLCWGSMEGVALPELISLASSAGFHAITLNSVLYEDAIATGLSDTDIAGMLADHNLLVSNIDPLFNWLPSSVRVPGTDVMSRLTQASAGEIFHLAHLTGTDLVNAPLGLATPSSEQEIVDCFGALCELAAKEELRVCLEFMPFTAVCDLATADRIVAGAGCDNGGIMFDCWHHHRSGGQPEQLSAIPPERFFAMQLDDALPYPMDDIIEETLNHRELPGEGCIDLESTLGQLREIGAEMICDVEVFKASLRQESPGARAEILFEAASKFVGRPVSD